MTPELLRDILALCDWALAYHPDRCAPRATGGTDWVLLFDFLNGLRSRAVSCGGHEEALLIDVVRLHANARDGAKRARYRTIADTLSDALLDDARKAGELGWSRESGDYLAAMRRLLADPGGAP